MSVHTELFNANYKIGQLTYARQALLEVINKHINVEELDMIDRISVEATLETVLGTMKEEENV